MYDNIIATYAGSIIDDFDEFDFICELPCVERVVSNGLSGLHFGYDWYTCFLVDGFEFDFYFKEKQNGSDR